MKQKLYQRILIKLFKCKKEKTPLGVFVYIEAVDGFEPTIKLLQSRALPLGYTALTFIIIP